MLKTMSALHPIERSVMIPSHGTRLSGLLAIPAHARHIVLFAHASANCCHNLPNHCLAHNVYQRGVATLLVDLISRAEQCLCQRAELHYDRTTLAMRLVDVTDWLHTANVDLKISYLGLSEGAAIAILAAIERPELIHSLILPSGNPAALQLALRYVQAPALLISGESDFMHILAAQRALPHLPPGSSTAVVSRSTTLLERENLTAVSQIIGDWLEPPQPRPQETSIGL